MSLSSICEGGIILIGLTGQAGSGKDSVCDALQGYLPDRILKRDAFANRLKVSAARALGLDEPEEDLITLMNHLKDGGGLQVVWPGSDGDLITGRQYLQWYGTEAHREVFGEDFWINQVLPNPFDPYYGRTDYFNDLVLTDIRFINEAERVKECGGQIWRIVRQDGVAVSHSSEEPLPQTHVDLLLLNNGTLDDLKRRARTHYLTSLGEESYI